MMRDDKSLTIRTHHDYVTTITSATDLVIWLISNTVDPDSTPNHFAEPATMLTVLARLSADDPDDDDNKSYTADRVWEVVRAVATNSGAPDGSDDDDEDDTDGWALGEWDKVIVDPQQALLGGKGKPHLGIVPEDVPFVYRRRMSAAAHQQAATQTLADLAGYKLVGVHATRAEALGPLVMYGPSVDKIDSGHHVGKGRGFYFIPFSHAAVQTTVNNALAWGPFVVAVFLPKKFNPVRADDGDNVATLDAAHPDSYYVFGDLEAVISERDFARIKIACGPVDIASPHADQRCPVDKLMDRIHQLDFLTELGFVVGNFVKKDQ